MPDRLDPSVGLCAQCAHARVQQSARGSVFWRCGRAEGDDPDPRFLRYPPLPVALCSGHEPGRPQGSPRTEEDE